MSAPTQSPFDPRENPEVYGTWKEDNEPATWEEYGWTMDFWGNEDGNTMGAWIFIKHGNFPRV